MKPLASHVIESELHLESNGRPFVGLQVGLWRCLIDFLQLAHGEQTGENEGETRGKELS